MHIEIPERDVDILAGVTDLHVHQHPDIFERTFDEASFALQARTVGYRGILFKSHTSSNVERMHYVRKIAPGIEVFGGIVLNRTVGGINPEAVETALALGARQVWMPTIHAAHHIEVLGSPSLFPGSRKKPSIQRNTNQFQGLTIRREDGTLDPALLEVIDLVAQSNAILGTGHLSVEEIFTVVSLARERGVERVLVTHPEYIVTDLSTDDQIQLTKLGAYIEHCFYPCMPCARRYDPHMMAKSIQRVGASRCVMSSDFGQLFNPHPIEGMRHFIHVMQICGIPDQDIEAMTKSNPAQLLGLDA